MEISKEFEFDSSHRLHNPQKSEEWNREKFGKYSWQGNYKQDEIASKIEELVNSEVELTKSNCLPEDEVIKLTSGLSIDAISSLLRFLKK